MIYEIQNELLKLAVFFREEKLTKQHIALYAESLKDHDVNKIKFCISEYCKDPKNSFFPVPPTKILKYAEPVKIDETSLAVQIASKAFQAISKFGWCNSDKAKEFIGAQGWEAIQRFGGWNYVCEQVGVTIDQTTFLAQLREIVKSGINFERNGADYAALTAPSNLISLENRNRFKELLNQNLKEELNLSKSLLNEIV